MSRNWLSDLPNFSGPEYKGFTPKEVEYLKGIYSMRRVKLGINMEELMRIYRVDILSLPLTLPLSREDRCLIRRL